MTSKKQYYERKTAGLCTKCGNPLEDSISKTRCKPCYLKFKKNEEQKNDKKEDLHPEYDLELESKIEESLIQYKDQNQDCKVCNKKIDTLGVLCKNCLANVQFTKADAVVRYGQKCSNCEESDMEFLRLISVDISQPMQHHGPNLYKVVCSNSTKLKNYKISCHNCYRRENFNYINELRKTLEEANPINNNEIDDMININYEERL